MCPVIAWIATIIGTCCKLNILRLCCVNVQDYKHISVWLPVVYRMPCMRDIIYSVHCYLLLPFWPSGIVSTNFQYSHWNKHFVIFISSYFLFQLFDCIGHNNPIDFSLTHIFFLLYFFLSLFLCLSSFHSTYHLLPLLMLLFFSLCTLHSLRCLFSAPLSFDSICTVVWCFCCCSCCHTGRNQKRMQLHYQHQKYTNGVHKWTTGCFYWWCFYGHFVVSILLTGIKTGNAEDNCKWSGRAPNAMDTANGTERTTGRERKRNTNNNFQ